MPGQIVGRNLPGLQRLLHGTQQHRHHRAIRMVPVDVVEHLLAGVQQRVERADPLRSRRGAGRLRRLQQPHRAEQPCQVNAAVGHVAAARVTREIVELIHIEWAAEQPHQQRVARRQWTVARRIDDIGHSLAAKGRAARAPWPPRPFDDTAANALMRLDGIAQLLDGMREG